MNKFTSYYKANKKKKLCHRITPKLESFKRPNGAQIEAELGVSALGGLFFGFVYRVAQKRRSRWVLLVSTKSEHSITFVAVRYRY